MTDPLRPRRAIAARLAPSVLLLLALAGCAGTGHAGATPSASTSASASASAGPCAEVTVIVDFGTFDSPAIRACGTAGVALDTLKAAKVSTEGSGDYGDAVVCRVDNHPTPAEESCAKLPSDAYWALWVKSSADGKWEYAQEGVATLKLTAG
jgi:hypothetical protein